MRRLALGLCALSLALGCQPVREGDQHGASTVGAVDAQAQVDGARSNAEPPLMEVEGDEVFTSEVPGFLEIRRDQAGPMLLNVEAIAQVRRGRGASYSTESGGGYFERVMVTFVGGGPVEVHGREGTYQRLCQLMATALELKSKALREGRN